MRFDSGPDVRISDVPEVAASALDGNRYRTAQELVADRLRRAVLSGSLEPGERLLQAVVAADMQTSTTPVREAMRELAGEGLLDLDPHRGVVVHRPSTAELQEIYRIRAVLEPMAIVATIESVEPAQLDVAHAILARMERPSDVAEWTLLNARFHSILAEASGQPLLTSILDKLRNLSTLYVATMIDQQPDLITEANDEHRKLVEACRSRDVEAAQAIVVAHLNHTRLSSMSTLG